ncbi:MAG: hypothetical protein U0169_15770 [Polyangiaceae bacterium]
MSKASRLAFDVALVVGMAHVVLLLGVGVLRVAYPFDVEWMEGGELTHAVRLVQGAPLYARPSADFTAFFYTPFYPAVVACLAKVAGGVTHALGRGVSFASTLATLLLLFGIVRREAGTRYALLAVSTYAALDRFSGTFTTVARPDALALALAFGACVVVHVGRHALSAVIGAVLAVLAIFTKQTMVIPVLAVAVWLFVTSRRRGGIFAGVASVLGGLAAVALEKTSGGWFSFYVVSGHQSHAFFWINVAFYFWRDVLFLAPLLLLLPLAWAYARFGRTAAVLLLVLHVSVAFVERALSLDYPPHMYFRELVYESPRWLLLVPPVVLAGLLSVRVPKLEPVRPADAFWLWMFAAATLTSAVGHSTQWAYKNAFLPMSLFGALFLARSAKDLADGTSANPLRPGSAFVFAAFAFQFLALFDAPLSRVPRAADHEKVRALRERLARIEGPVLVIAHPLLAYEHDGTVHVHQMGLQDVAALGGVDQFEQRAAAHAWRAVVTDEGDGIDVPPSIPAHYAPAEVLDGPEMKTGTRMRPSRLWVPRIRP